MHAEGMKKKSKMAGLKALIAQMHKAMMSGDGDKPKSVESAMAETEKDLGVGNKAEVAEEAGEQDFASKVKEYMTKSGKIPVKGKTVMMKAEVKKMPMMGKKKYG